MKTHSFISSYLIHKQLYMKKGTIVDPPLVQCSQKGRRFWIQFSGVCMFSQCLGSSPGIEGSPEGCIQPKSSTALKADWLQHRGQELICIVPCLWVDSWKS